jgi:hypothetical protein
LPRCTGKSELFTKKIDFHKKKFYTFIVISNFHIIFTGTKRDKVKKGGKVKDGYSEYYHQWPENNHTGGNYGSSSRPSGRN